MLDKTNELTELLLTSRKLRLIHVKNRNTMMMLCCAIAAAGCGSVVPLTLTDDECKLMTDAPEVMRVLTVDNRED